MSNLPPKDVAPSELFARLTSTPRPHRIVDLPRIDTNGEPVGRVAMVPLTQDEMIIAAAEAEKSTRKRLSEGLPKREEAQLGYEDVYNNTAACEVLFRACISIDDPELKKRAFKTPHEIAKAFSVDEIAVLHHHYLTIKSEMGPIVSLMTPDEEEAWITTLANGGSALPLGCLSWGALTTLVLSMARRLHASRTAKSSPGLPQDESAPNPDDAEVTW